MQYWFALMVSAAALIASTTGFTAPTVEQYGELPATSQLKISADGSQIAFRRFEAGRDTVMVYSLTENKLLRAIDTSEVVPESIDFIGANRVIIRASDRKKIIGFKGTHDIRAAYALDVTSGSLEQLLRLGDEVYLGQTDIGSIIGISADKKSVYMPALVAKSDTRSFTDQGQGPSDNLGYAVMRVDLEHPDNPAKISRDDVDAFDYFMGPDGAVLVEERYGEYTNQHEILVKSGSKWTRIFEEKAEQRTIDLVGLTPDYRSLVLLTYGENDRRQFLTMSLADGKLSDPGINSNDHDIEEVITDINRIVYGVRFRGFLPKYKFFDKALDTRIDKIVSHFSGNSVSLESWSEDWKNIVVYVSGSNYAGEYYLFDENSKITFLSNSRPKIANADMHPIAIVTITARDGLKIPTLLTIPRDKVATMKNLPAVVMPHGGPRSNDTIGFDWMAQALANEGYMVIQPQFRGSLGFGWSFIEAGLGEWGGKMLDDITDAVDFTIGKGMVDKNRVCIVGGSYGGYAALASGANLPTKYQCIVAVNGVANMVDLLNKDKYKFGKYHSWIAALEAYVDVDNASKDKLVAISPYYKANKFEAPVLLIHSKNDERVELDQSKDMAAQLKKAKKQVKLVELEAENHYLQKNESRIKSLKAIVSFVNQHLN